MDFFHFSLDKGIRIFRSGGASILRIQDANKDLPSEASLPANIVGEHSLRFAGLPPDREHVDAMIFE